MTDEIEPSITLGEFTYALAELPQLAQEAVKYLQLVEVRLQQLHNEMAVSQTAHVAYARALKAELAKTPGAALSTMPSP
jgi:hypothetical protein